MLRAISRLCADLSVARKLATGFALVLVLTLLVAATGFYAVSAVVQRYTQTNLLSQINSHILHARQAEKELGLKGNPQAAQEIRTRLNQVLEQLDAMIAVTPASEQASLQIMQQAAADYLQQFEDFTRQQDKARTAQGVMTEAANEATSQFGEIEMDIYNAARDPGMTARVLLGGDPLVVAQNGSRLSKRMLELRASESAYLSDASEQTLGHWQDSNEELKTEARNLTHWLDESHKQDVLMALQALDQYQQGFEGYQQASAASQASESAMVRQAERVVELATQGQQREEQVMSEVNSRVVLVLAVISLVAIAVGIGSAVLISRLIIGPLRQTVAFAQRVAAGDLSQTQTQTQPLQRQRRDELGQLLGSMHGMAQSLSTLVGRIGGGVGQIASSADELSAITARTCAGVQTQRLETEQAASAMQQMSATVQEVERNAVQASIAAQQADQQARQGDSIVQQAVRQIGNLATEMEHCVGIVQQVHQDSSQIGSVVEVIRNVAKQTNLLALNTAIEAARAGDQGRGFAVVADEVRALAQRTDDSTREIEALIGNLQRGVQQAVVQMDNSRNLTHATVELAGQAGASLVRITQAVSTIEQMNQQIASATTQQSLVARTIGESITSIRDIAEQSASASERTTLSSTNLARLGAELHALTGQFRT